MNNEFKKIKNKTETRYVLETATADATSSSAIATSASKIGELRRRLQELKDRISVPKSKPRNPVGMGATQGRGTKKHQNSSRQRSRDEKKLSVDENNEMDHEISMASNELKSIAKDAVNLLILVKQKSEQEGLQAWQQSKITKAADFMNSVLQSVSGDEDQGVAEGMDPEKRSRLDDLIDQYRDSTDPNDYYDRDYSDPEDVIAMIRAEFGDRIADQVAAGADKMHFSRPGHTSWKADPLGWKKPIDRTTKAGKMYKQDSDFRKNTIKSRYKLSGKSATEGVAEGDYGIPDIPEFAEFYNKKGMLVGTSDHNGFHFTPEYYKILAQDFNRAQIDQMAIKSNVAKKLQSGAWTVKQGVAEGSDKLQGTPVVSLKDFSDKDTKKDKYGRTVPKKLKKDDPRVKFYKDQKQGVAEGLRDTKDNPCWKNYKPVGTKKKGGRIVPNCVPKEDVNVEENGLQYHIGVKKHGKTYMVKAAQAAQKGASQAELGALKDKYSKAYKNKKNEDTYVSKLQGMLEQLKKN